jgi:hypothetical protein
VIYFVQAESVGHIKIGWHAGTDAAERVRELQVGSPVKLTLLGTMPGERETEADLHRQFSHAHVHGEWFRAVPELLNFIGNKGEDWRQGPAEVQTRFVQIKVLTVGNKQLTPTMFRQIPEVHIVKWEDIKAEDMGPATELPLCEGAVPWGRVLLGKETPPDQFFLLWEYEGELRRCFFSPKVPVCLTVEGGLGYCRTEAQLVHDSGDKGIYLELARPYRLAWLRLLKRFLPLDQLYLGG